MDDVTQKLIELEQKIDKVWRSVEQMRKITLWTMIIGLILFVVPLIGLAFVIPQYIKTLNISQYLQ